MPVPGNFRFFVKRIDEEDGECLFEEFLNESDILPLYDRQIVVECKSILNWNVNKYVLMQYIL